MSRFFKKKIDPIHVHRDYDAEFSSKNDVMPSLALLPIASKKVKKIETRESDIIKREHTSKTFNTFTTGGPWSGKDDDVEGDDYEDSFKKTTTIFNFHGKSYIYCKKSLYIFGPGNRIRKFAVWLTESLLFKLTSLIIITLYAIMVGLVDFLDPDKFTSTNQTFQVVEFITIIFNAGEAILLIIARGFAHGHNAYLTSLKNWIDFFVAVTGVLVFTDTFRYFPILRVYNVVGFLITIPKFKNLAQMMSVLSSSAIPLVSIIALLLFVMCLFAILGLNFYSGKLNYRCRITEFPVNGLWVTTNELRICGGDYKCETGEFCGSNYDYPDDISGSLSKDTNYPEFNYGLTTFDNVLQSLFTVFLINNGNWENLINNLSDGSDNLGALIYFSLTYAICNFCIYRLAVAVMLDFFTKIKEKENKHTHSVTFELLHSENIDDKLKNLMNGEQKPIQTWKDKWRFWKNKYFPSVDIPKDDYYKNGLTRFLFKIATHALFKYCIILLVIINLIVVALDREGISKSAESAIGKSENE